MKFTGLALMSIFFLSSSLSYGARPTSAAEVKSWMACKKTPDCAISEGSCEPVCYNKKNKAKVTAFVKKQKGTAQCVGPAKQVSDMKVACVSNMCACQPK